MKTMAAGSFKVHCLAVMDEVQAKREAVVITKHGKPVVKLVPADKDAGDIYGFLAGKGAITGDTVSPAISGGEWGELKCVWWIRMFESGWHSTRIGCQRRRERPSTMHARVEMASPFATSRSWSWLHFSGRVAFVWKSVSNPFSMKSRPGSLCYRSAAERWR